jgi:hypothetical protein
MSTKSSWFLTDDDEHWYLDVMDDSLNLEINIDATEMIHEIKDVRINNKKLFITLKPGTALYDMLLKIMQKPPVIQRGERWTT